jgi:hypothetical protein
MPAFVFNGNQTAGGIATDLYRIYVFTDRDCINVVYRGALVGSPAYAPRPFGPLSLPRTAVALNAARGGYLPDGDEGSAWAADFASVKTTEVDKPATPTTTAKASAAPTTGGSSGSGGSGSGGSGSGGSGSGSSGSTSAGAGLPQAPPEIVIKPDVKLGAPVDLWDTDWPRGGYYWTVIPVLARQPPTLQTTVATLANSGTTTLELASAGGLAVGDALDVGPTPGERVSIVAISGTTVTLGRSLTAAHGAGEQVVRVSGSLEYRELELAQEACASGRVMRFGKTSEPALTGAVAPFVSGLSPSGRLMSAATRTPKVYGTPHVAWTPALGASVYEVQWSKTGYPFKTENDLRTGRLGFLTGSTSAILPLKAGTWWYRVRGINWSLPTGAQQMSWSEPAKVIVARPQFRVVRR